MNYKNHIKNELEKYHWEIITIDSIDEWWEDEYWHIQWRHSNGPELYIQFLVDPEPIWTNNIYEIRALIKLEKIRLLNENSSQITSINMNKQKFNIKLKKFISEIEIYRKNKL